MFAMSEENVLAVRQIIAGNKLVTYRIIWSTLGIEMTAIEKVLQDHFEMRKVCCRWVTHNFTEAQK